MMHEQPGRQPPLEQVAVLMALMRDLEGLMRAEDALLREMRLDRMRDVQGEKASLAAAYEAELRRLRGAPEAVAALEPEARAALVQATRHFQAAAKQNAVRLEAARGVVEGVVRTLGASLAASRTAGAYRPGASAVPRGQVVSIGLNRHL